MKKKIICGIIALVMATIMTVQAEAKRNWMVEELSGQVFRFHVLANSDSKEDQQLKMQVKEAVIAYMEEEIPNAQSADQTKQWAKSHLQQLEEVSSRVIAEQGYSYAVHAEVTTDYFPDKTYGDVTFPAGEYEALRIEIGASAGQNWWCVLFPNLCFIDAVKAVVPSEGKEKLQNVLEEDTYEMVIHPPKWKIGWFFF